MTVLSVFPEPMTCPSLSSISTLMYGSVIISWIFSTCFTIHTTFYYWFRWWCCISCFNRFRNRTIWSCCIVSCFYINIAFRNWFCWCNYRITFSSVTPEPITWKSLSNNSTLVLGSVDTETGV